MVDKFAGTERKSEFEDYSKTMHDFESAIFQEMKSKVYQINRKLQEMNEMLNERIN
jgi:division protein CdvB (Snf7/Vps24/ESCRT-III family)